MYAWWFFSGGQHLYLSEIHWIDKECHLRMTQIVLMVHSIPEAI